MRYILLRPFFYTRCFMMYIVYIYIYISEVIDNVLMNRKIQKANTARAQDRDNKKLQSTYKEFIKITPRYLAQLYTNLRLYQF